MIRANVSPLLAAFTALRASETAERNGDTAEAMKQALEAIESTQAWREQLREAELFANPNKAVVKIMDWRYGPNAVKF